jgi:hypothetical protein
LEKIRELKQRMNALMQKEKLIGVEFRYRPLTTKEGVHYCEPEQGDILGEDDVERRLVDSLIDSLESSDQHDEDMLTKESREVEGLNVFKTDDLCMFAGKAGDRQSLEVVMKMEEEKEMYKDILKGKDQNCILMENEAMLSHEDNQGRTHAHLDDEGTDRQSKGFVVAGKEELAHEDSQQEVEEKHSDEMLTRWNEEIELLERLLIGPESERGESTTNERTCSHMSSSEREMLIAYKEKEVNFNFNFNLKIAGIPVEDEHDMGVASRLFPKEEGSPQVVNIGEELNFLERWLTKGEDCREYADLIQVEEKMNVSIRGGTEEGNQRKNPEDIIQDMMQQLVDNNNNIIQQREGNNKWQSMYQPKDQLDIEIEMIMELMRKMSQKKKTTVRKKISSNKQVTTTDCERKSSGALQHKVWKPGEVQATTSNNRIEKQMEQVEGFSTKFGTLEGFINM